MEKFGNQSKQNNLWYTAALLMPVVHSASLLPWPVVLTESVAAVFLGRFSKWGTGWVLTLQRIWAAVIAGIFLQWSGYYWGDLSISKIAPVILLVLSLWTTAVQGKAPRIGCVLIWPLVFLLGAVLLSGTSEVKTEYLKPTWQMGAVSLAALLLIPTDSDGKTKWKLPLAVIAVSVITSGVLSPAVAVSSESGIYEISRSLSLLGVAERFESLIAAAMTMGVYAGVSYLLEPKEKKNIPWLYALIALLIYLSGIEIGKWYILGISVLTWTVFPIVQARKIIVKKGKKGIDK